MIIDSVTGECCVFSIDVSAKEEKVVKIRRKGNSVDTEYPCRAGYCTGVGTALVQQQTFHNSLLCPSRSPLKREIKAGIF